MDDSARLRAAVERAARERGPSVQRAPIRQLAIELGRRHGVDLTNPADIAYADQLLEEAERNAHRERLARRADILLARLPAKFRNATFPVTDFGHKAQQWLAGYRQARRNDRPARSLVILGGTGTGKTWTACAIARALLTEDAVPVTVTTVADFLADLRPAVGGLDVDMLQFTLAPVLVLDDLGMERLTEWGAEQLYRMADERSRNNRPVIVTSNLSGAEIREQYDRRTVERLFGGARLIEITGESRREMPF